MGYAVLMELDVDLEPTSRSVRPSGTSSSSASRASHARDARQHRTKGCQI